MKLLPEELFVALECCLDDANDQVTRAAAITLYTLERPLPKVFNCFGFLIFLLLFLKFVIVLNCFKLFQIVLNCYRCVY